MVSNSNTGTVILIAYETVNIRVHMQYLKYYVSKYCKEKQMPTFSVAREIFFVSFLVDSFDGLVSSST